MTERPILFSAEMVRAILDGRKTQTRRKMKVQPWPDAIVTVEHYHQTVIDRCGDMQPGPEIFGAHWDDECGLRCPYGAPGDLLWVRETWFDPQMDGGRVLYAADKPDVHPIHRRRPSIHMPRWASRIMLRITDVRVERLQAISEDDARAEGCEPVGWIDETDVGMSSYREGFSRLWNDINGPGAWDANPYVWVISFERVKP